MTTTIDQPGVCRVCKCTHDRPCDVGCSWADRGQTLCTACVVLEEDALAKLREALQKISTALTDLPQQILDDDDCSFHEPRAKRYVERELKRRVAALRQAIRNATKNPDLRGLARAR